MTRYPFAPLAEAMRKTPRQAAIELGLWADAPALTEGLLFYDAERLAVRAGFPALFVWPEMAYVEPVLCANPRCGEEFVPESVHQRFHSRACCARHHAAVSRARKRQAQEVAA